MRSPQVRVEDQPSAFVVATQAHSVHPDLHRASAKRMGATTYRGRQRPLRNALTSRRLSRRDPTSRPPLQGTLATA